MNNEIYIEELTNFSAESADALRRLTAQLNENFQPLSDEDIHGMVDSSNTHVYLARLKENDSIVGMVTLIVYRIPYIVKAQLEDIVVDESMRGKGIGKMLMQYVIDKAKEYGVKSLNFTSSPKKEVANKLYESLGFQKRETNVYQLSL